MMQAREFKRSGQTFVDRVGEPDALEAAVGRVVQAFGQLDEQLNTAIAHMLSLPPTLAPTVATSMTFDGKLQVFTSAVANQAVFVDPFTGIRSPPKSVVEFSKPNPQDYANVLAEQARQAEWFKDFVVRSAHLGKGPGRTDEWTWVSRRPDGELDEDEVDADLLLDIADYIVEAAMDIEEFVIPVQQNSLA